MEKELAVVELNADEIDAVSGGIIGPVLWGLSYIGALQVAADFGAGLGRGFYDATHDIP